MKFLFANLAIAALASMAEAQTIVPRAESVTVDTVIASINNIKNETQSLQNTVDNFQGKGSEAIGLQIVISDLKGTIYDAVDQVNQLAVLDSADSTKLGTATLSLAPIIKSSLDATTAKQDQFNEALPGVVSGIVAGDLTELRAGSAALSAAIKSKLSGPIAGAAPIVISQIDGYFTSAIHVFATASNAPGGEPTGNAAIRGPSKQFDPYAFGPAVFAVAALAL